MLRFDFSPWAGVVSAVWLAFYILGRRQFARVRRGTAELVLEQGRRAGQMASCPSVEAFYTQLQPEWEAMLGRQAWFLPHRSELFPVPVRPADLRRRLNFTPGWVGAYLRLNGVHLPAGTELEKEIQRILALAGPPGRAR
jgi:hypothetical protein